MYLLDNKSTLHRVVGAGFNIARSTTQNISLTLSTNSTLEAQKTRIDTSIPTVVAGLIQARHLIEIWIVKFVQFGHRAVLIQLNSRSWL